MSYTFHEATIVKIVQETDIVKRFFIQMPDTLNFTFTAGQFIMINLPIASKYTNRSYSIASAPSDDNIFELCIVLKPTGLGTPYTWENFEVGTKVQASLALGKFIKRIWSLISPRPLFNKREVLSRRSRRLKIAQHLSAGY